MNNATEPPEGAAAEARILFVCSGNTCRSPMAVALTAARLPGVETSSAGTGAVADRAATRLAIDEMQRRDDEDGGKAGSDRPRSTAIRAHRSRKLASDMTSDVDIVVCMEQHHADVVGQPSGVDVRVWNVPDPIFENTPEAYKRCADTLAQRIDDLAKELGRRD